MNRKFGLGILMILFGIMWFLGNMKILEGELFLILVSLGFFATYILTGSNEKRGNIGFLIPACITFMVGAFAALEENVNLGNIEGALFFVFLGISFFMVYFIHTIHLKSSSFGERNWPAITGASIFAFAIAIFLIEALRWEVIGTIFSNFWPAVLIIIGVLMLIKELLFKKKDV